MKWTVISSLGKTHTVAGRGWSLQKNYELQWYFERKTDGFTGSYRESEEQGELYGLLEG